jgi:hypothetical protein
MNKQDIFHEGARAPSNIPSLHTHNIYTPKGSAFTPSCAIDKSNTECLYDLFHAHFEITEANTPALLKEVHKIRYDAYCLEREFEKAVNNKVGWEEDQYDSLAKHALLKHKKSGAFFGTTRIILADTKKKNSILPVQSVCKDTVIEKMVIPPKNRGI